MAIMKSGYRNPIPISLGEEPSLAGFILAGCFFKPHDSPHTLTLFPPSVTTLSSTRQGYIGYRTSYDGQESPYLSILGQIYPETTHPHLLSFFDRVSHSCIRRRNRVENTPAIERLEGRSNQELPHCRPVKSPVHAHSLRQQAFGSDLSNYRIDPIGASFRCFEGPMAAEMAQIARRGTSRMAEATRAVSLKGGHMTDLEKESLETLYQVRDALAVGKVHRHTHMNLMGVVRDSIQHLENKKYGCATGRHSSYCQCKEASHGL